MASPTTIDSRAVANYFLSKASVEQERVDPLKLLKLVYIAHGWHLGLRSTPLVTQQVYAWPLGPVIPEVYHAFKRYGYSPIEGQSLFYDKEVNDWRPYSAVYLPETKEIVDRVWDSYKRFSGAQLSTLTHQSGSPWAEVTKGIGPEAIRDIPIPNELIRAHYRELALRNMRSKEMAGGIS